jgi:phosphatidylglycerophosphatase A
LFLIRVQVILNIMKDQKTMSDKITKLILSLGYCGFFPKAPGTVGTLLSIPIIFFLKDLSLELNITMVIIFTILAIIITQNYQKKWKLHDPSWIVIDEFLGFYTTSLFIFPQYTFKNVLVAFILFRFFDIVKFWPASYFDKMHHGAGTILDDIVSGLFAGLSTFLLLNFF